MVNINSSLKLLAYYLCHGALYYKEMKTCLVPIVKQIWLWSVSNCHNYFAIFKTQQLTAWADAILHLLQPKDYVA